MKPMFKVTGVEIFIALLFGTIMSVSLSVGAFVFHVHRAFIILTEFIPIYLISFIVILILYEINQFLIQVNQRRLK